MRILLLRFFYKFASKSGNYRPIDWSRKLYKLSREINEYHVVWFFSISLFKLHYFTSNDDQTHCDIYFCGHTFTSACTILWGLVTFLWRQVSIWNSIYLRIYTRASLEEILLTFEYILLKTAYNRSFYNRKIRTRFDTGIPYEDTLFPWRQVSQLVLHIILLDLLQRAWEKFD